MLINHFIDGVEILKIMKGIPIQRKIIGEIFVKAGSSNFVIFNFNNFFTNFSNKANIDKNSSRYIIIIKVVICERLIKIIRRKWRT